MNIRRSIRRLSILFVILFVAVSGGLVYWQVVVAQQVSSNPYLTLNRKCLPDSTPKRGRIFDRNGVLLAESVAIPVNTNNPNANNLCIYQRYYTHPSMANLIGYYVSPLYCSISARFCSSGIERQFDDYLSGRNGITGVNNTINQALHLPPVGDDIYLTIDVRIQDIVDKDFDTQAQPSGPNDTSVFTTHTGSVIVTDPKTGEILAMVSHPTYDSNRVASGDRQYLQQLLSDPHQPLINRAIDDCYVPGSTYKTLTLMSALDTNTFDLDTPQFYNDGDPTHLQAIGPIRLGSVNDTEKFGPIGNNIDYYTFHYPVNLRYGYSHSDNIIFAQVGAKTGVDTWLKYNHNFYVGQQIPFDLPVRVSTVTPQSQKNLCSYTPPPETPLTPYRKYASPVLFSILGSGLSATISFLVQEFLRGQKARLANSNSAAQAMKSRSTRPCTHKPGRAMRRRLRPLCRYSDQVRAAAQYVAMDPEDDLASAPRLSPVTFRVGCLTVKLRVEAFPIWCASGCLESTALRVASK